jgi:hypothetical protein
MKKILDFIVKYQIDDILFVLGVLTIIIFFAIQFGW